MVVNILKKPVVFCLSFIAVCLGACSGLTQSDKPAVISWWLVPYTNVAESEPPDPVSSVLVSVAVVPGLDTDRILALSENSVLKPYSSARWVENLPELTTSLVSRTLQASGRFEVVSERARASYNRCDLQLELREFFASLGASGQTRSVHIALNGSYQCESEALIPVRLKASVPVSDGRMKDIVAAFQQALDRVMQDLLVELS